jgi:hypothetical protein
MIINVSRRSESGAKRRLFNRSWERAIKSEYRTRRRRRARLDPNSAHVSQGSQVKLPEPDPPTQSRVAVLSSEPGSDAAIRRDGAPKLDGANLTTHVGAPEPRPESHLSTAAAGPAAAHKTTDPCLASAARVAQGRLAVLGSDSDHGANAVSRSPGGAYERKGGADQFRPPPLLGADAVALAPETACARPNTAPAPGATGAVSEPPLTGQLGPSAEELEVGGHLLQVCRGHFTPMSEEMMGFALKIAAIFRPIAMSGELYASLRRFPDVVQRALPLVRAFSEAANHTKAKNSNSFDSHIVTAAAQSTPEWNHEHSDNDDDGD